MNNQCPHCAAVYNVAAKDIGRRLQCKKCSSPLVVTEAGLEPDDPYAPPPAAGPGAAPARRDRAAAWGVLGLDPARAFRDFGGVAAVLFGAGAFLVIVFLFQPIIGTAAVDRAKGAVERLDLDWKAQERRLRRDKKPDEEIGKAREEFYKKRDRDELEEAAGYETVGNKRGRWVESYGMMFGFLFLMAGSMGFMMPEQALVRRILGTAVLGIQILIIFMVFAAGGGCRGGPAG